MKIVKDKLEGIVREFILPDTFEVDFRLNQDIVDTFEPEWMSYEAARKELNQAYGKFFESVWRSRSQTTLNDIVEQAVQDFDPSTLIGARQNIKQCLQRVLKR